MICIKKELVDVDVNDILYGNTISSSDKGCNILQVTLPLKCGKKLTVVGCRMETGGKKSWRELYDSERHYFDVVLIPMIKNIDKDNICIVGGDFNNAICRGKLSEKFNSRDYVKGNTEYAQYNYNLNIIKDTFDTMGFTMMDIDEKEKAIPTCGTIPNDHIFVRGLKKKSCESIPVNKQLSDHKIILAECVSEIVKE